VCVFTGSRIVNHGGCLTSSAIAPRYAELRTLAAKIFQTVEDDRENHYKDFAWLRPETVF
jgi:hypothetical protein